MYSISGIYYIRHVQKYINYAYQLIQHIHTKQCLTKPVIFCIVQINSGHPESQIISKDNVSITKSKNGSCQVKAYSQIWFPVEKMKTECEMNVAPVVLFILNL